MRFFEWLLHQETKFYFLGTPQESFSSEFVKMKSVQKSDGKAWESDRELNATDRCFYDFKIPPTAKKEFLTVLQAPQII